MKSGLIDWFAGYLIKIKAMFSITVVTRTTGRYFLSGFI